MCNILVDQVLKKSDQKQDECGWIALNNFINRH